MRLLSAALANTDATDARALTTESFWTVKLSAIDYAKTFKVSLDTAYEQMAKALDRLLRASSGEAAPYAERGNPEAPMDITRCI